MTGQGKLDDLSGVILSNGSQPVGTFNERVLALREAGFTSMGLSYWTYREILASGMSNAAINELLNDSGVRIAELEVALGFDADRRGWASATPRWGPAWLGIDVSYVDADVERSLFTMADAFRARHLVAVGSWQGAADIGASASAFGGLCDRAADHGLKIAIEFVPGTSVPNAATAFQVVSAADRPNGGICFDSWHYLLGTDDPEVVHQIPPEKITVLQLADGSLRASGQPISDDDYFRATTTQRELLGAGDFDLIGLLRQIRQGSDEPMISIEILSRALGTMGVRAGAMAIAQSTRALLAEARGAPRPGRAAQALDRQH